MIARELLDVVTDANCRDVIARRISVPKETRTEWLAVCPFHDDATPSMRISKSKNRWFCDVCNTGGDAVKFVAEYEKIAFPAAVEMVAREIGVDPDRYKEKPRVTATYQYADAKGRVVGTKKRWQPAHDGSGKPKSFTWHGPDGGRGQPKPWAPVLYRLPEVVAAIDEGDLVFVVEGEKCADALSAAGLVATCNEDGAGKWRPEHAAALRGADVVVLADNDEAGRKHADAVIASLNGIAAKVRQVELPRMKPKGDVFDWLHDGGTAEELCRLATAKPAPESEPVAEDDGAWRELLSVNKDGECAPSTVNSATVFLENLPQFRGLFAFDEFAQAVVLTRTPPWDDVAQDRARALTDADLVRLAGELDRAERCRLETSVLHKVVSAVARANRINPLRSWLECLRWDGTPRLDTWLTRYLGADESAYTRAVGAAWCRSAVARVFQPGCQADHVLVLEGIQGIGKSTAMRTLVGDAYFSDDMPDLNAGKEAAIQLGGKWVIEFAELDALKKSEAHKIKAFISRRVDRFRRPFSREAEDVPRSCVFVMTTNESTYLVDDENRRFWPVAARALDTAALAADREQLWAEAVHGYRGGGKWYLDDPELRALAAEEQGKRREADVWEAAIYKAIDGRESVSVAEVLESIGVAAAHQNRFMQARAGSVVRSAGYTQRRQVIDEKSGRRVWRFFKPAAPHQPHLASVVQTVVHDSTASERHDHHTHHTHHINEESGGIREDADSASSAGGSSEKCGDDVHEVITASERHSPRTTSITARPTDWTADPDEDREEYDL